MRIHGIFRLRDLRPISQKEFDAARRICEKIRNCTESRAAYINEHNLDPDIALPTANWAEDAPNALYDLYWLVVTPTYDVINRLRLYTQPFSGYHLASFSKSYRRTSPIPYPIPDNFDEEIAPEPDPWVHRYIVMTHNLPTEMIAKPPRILGEIGWNVGGSPVNYDTYAYQERLNCLFETGIIDWLRQKVEINGKVNILEIGGGYGGLAYHLKSILPQANYLICDLPEALLFSSIYLAIACPEFQHTIYDGTDMSIFLRNDFGFKFIPNFMFDDLVESKCKIDLAINTLSFAEMSEKQVRYYASNLKNILGDTGVLFEQNFIYFERDNLCRDLKSLISEYFVFRENIKPKSVPVLARGVVDIWGNKPISDIIKPSLKPFEGKKWRIYWMIHWAINRRIFRVLGLCQYRDILLIGPRMYGLLKGWWYSLGNKKAI